MNFTYFVRWLQKHPWAIGSHYMATAIKFSQSVAAEAILDCWKRNGCNSHTRELSRACAQEMHPSPTKTKECILISINCWGILVVGILQLIWKWLSCKWNRLIEMNSLPRKSIKFYHQNTITAWGAAVQTVGWILISNWYKANYECSQNNSKDFLFRLNIHSPGT